MKNKRSTTYRTIIAVVIITLSLASLPPANRALAAPGAAGNCAKSHVVNANDTLFKIAHTHQVTLFDLANANDLSFPYELFFGQTICIPLTDYNPTNLIEANPAFISLNWYRTFVTVKVAGFPRNATYAVYARLMEKSGDGAKIGALRTNNNGIGQSFLTITSEALKSADDLLICLEDALDGTRVCSAVTRSGIPPTTALPFFASLDGNELRIQGSGFEPFAFQNVRLNLTVNKSNQAWEKVDRVRADSLGAINATLELPNKYLDARILHVCLKDIVTDDVICITLFP